MNNLFIFHAALMKKTPPDDSERGFIYSFRCHAAVTEKRSQTDGQKGPNSLVSQGRFELPTFPLGGGCSIQLSY